LRVRTTDHEHLRVEGIAFAVGIAGETLAVDFRKLLAGLGIEHSVDTELANQIHTPIRSHPVDFGAGVELRGWLVSTESGIKVQRVTGLEFGQWASFDAMFVTIRILRTARVASELRVEVDRELADIVSDCKRQWIEAVEEVGIR